MGLFNDMRGGQFKPGPGVDKPPPAAGYGRFWFILRNHFWRLIAVNLLFLLFCIPILTIPAAMCGLNNVCAQLMLTGKCYLTLDFMDGFKRYFLAKTVFGMPFCVVIAGTVLMYVAEMRTVGFYIAVVAACYFFLSACYFFAYATGMYDIIATKEAPSRLFLRALTSCVTRKSSLRMLPALMLAAVFTVFYISLLPVMFVIGMSLIVTLAQSALVQK